MRFSSVMGASPGWAELFRIVKHRDSLSCSLEPMRSQYSSTHRRSLSKTVALSSLRE